MKRYFKPIKEKFTSAPDNYLGTILGEKGSITDLFSGGKTKFVDGDGEFGEMIDGYIQRGELIEITKEEAALLFGFV